MTQVVLAVSLVSVLATPPAWPAWQEAAEEPEVVIEGKGFGHGVGMPQDGAYAMGTAGAGVGDILSTFYPGTEISTRSGAVTVRVVLFDRPVPSVVLAFPAGGELAERGSGPQSPGLPVTVRAGGSVRVSFDGAYRVSPLDGAEVWRRPAPEETPAEPLTSNPLWAAPPGGSTVSLPELGKRYRGTLELQASGGGLALVNHVDIEQYLRGMGEVLEPGWPAAALQAQAVAARTYAIRYAAAGRALCSGQQCQVYLGQTAEYAAMNRAVADTEGQVLTYQGSLAEAVYSASGGGVTATPEEGFGPSSATYPYLRAQAYPTPDPQPWELRLTLRRLAARAGYRGEAAGVSVTRRGPSGRPLEISFTGDVDPLVIDARTFVDRLGLRSTLFTLRVEPPPDPASAAGGEPAAAKPEPSPRTPPRVLQAEVEGEPLGLAPWIALCLLLVVTGWAIVVRTASRPARAAAPPPCTAPRDSTAASRGSRDGRRRRSGPSPRRARTGSRS